MTEKELQKCVLDAAAKLGWLVAHFRPAMTKKGWRTAVEADGKGFPDLVLVGHGRVLFRELKGDGGKASPEQWLWADRLREAGANHAFWTPQEWRTGEIIKELRA